MPHGLTGGITYHTASSAVSNYPHPTLLLIVDGLFAVRIAVYGLLRATVTMHLVR
jgi:hypothetical protein